MIADAGTIRKTGSVQSVSSSCSTYIDATYERRRQVRWSVSRCRLQPQLLSRVTCSRTDKDL